MLSSALGRFRIVALLEGVSYLALLLIAMPLKYLADIPMAVRITGSVHGGLTLLFMVVLLHAWAVQRWSLPKLGLAFVCSLIPGGAFWFDRRIASEQPAE